MGTIIKSIAISENKSLLNRKGSIKLCSEAASRCLENANIDSSELDIIINTGIYRDNHIAEPSIASILQDKLRSKPNKALFQSPTNNGTGHTFSFDLSNSGCGVLNGIQVIDNLLKLGRISKGMIITGDANPIPELSRNFEFPGAAAAVFLTSSSNCPGFESISHYSYPEFKENFTGYTSWQRAKQNGGFRNVLNIEQDESYLGNCIQCASKSISGFFSENRITIEDIDLVIASQSPPGFPEGLREENKLPVLRNITENKRIAPYTAGPLFDLHSNWDKIQSGQANRILFVTVGAGISVSIALYRNHCAE